MRSNSSTFAIYNYASVVYTVSYCCDIFNSNTNSRAFFNASIRMTFCMLLYTHLSLGSKITFVK